MVGVGPHRVDEDLNDDPHGAQAHLEEGFVGASSSCPCRAKVLREGLHQLPEAEEDEQRPAERFGAVRRKATGQGVAEEHRDRHAQRRTGADDRARSPGKANPAHAVVKPDHETVGTQGQGEQDARPHHAWNRSFGNGSTAFYGMKGKRFCVVLRWWLQKERWEVGVRWRRTCVCKYLEGLSFVMHPKAERNPNSTTLSNCAPLPPSDQLALLIGAILGDGNLTQMSRCQMLDIACFEDQKEWIEELKQLITAILGKAPAMYKPRTRCIHLRLYKQGLSTILGLPPGNKIKNQVRIPRWIFSSRTYLLQCLRGLFETDGCFVTHEAKHVYIAELANHNQSLLDDCEDALRLLGYHPQRGSRYVRLARKAEILDFAASTGFSKVDATRVPVGDLRFVRKGKSVTCALPDCHMVVYYRNSWETISGRHYCCREHAAIDRRKVPRPDRTELMAALQRGTPWSVLARQYGVSDTAVRKWARAYKLLSNSPPARTDESD